VIQNLTGTYLFLLPEISFSFPIFWIKAYRSHRALGEPAAPTLVPWLKPDSASYPGGSGYLNQNWIEFLFF
jgi:hypothetical protein